MAKRPRVTKISITYEVDGKSHVKELDPKDIEAIFMTDHSVSEILAGFYHPQSPLRSTPPKSTPEKVQAMWNAETKAGHAPIVMIKHVGCDVTSLP